MAQQVSNKRPRGVEENDESDDELPPLHKRVDKNTHIKILEEELRDREREVRLLDEWASKLMKCLKPEMLEVQAELTRVREILQKIVARDISSVLFGQNPFDLGPIVTGIEKAIDIIEERWGEDP